MDKFSQLFYAYTDGRYDYLRIKNVDVNTETKTANVYIYVREDKYDNFDNEVIKHLRSFFAQVVKKYTFTFHFERLLVSADLVHRRLVEYVSVNYPFVAANILFDNVDVVVSAKDIRCTLYMPDTILRYANERGFEADLSADLADTFIMPTVVSVELTDEMVEEGDADEYVGLPTVVPVLDVQYLCGVKAEFGRLPVMLSTIRQAAERIAVCGNVSDCRCKTYEEPPKEQQGEEKARRFYKYHYTFTLNDGTDNIRVLFNTNDEKCPLKDVTSGQFVVRGRVFYNERLQAFNVFAKTVYTCRIDQAKLEEMMKPLPVPETYKYPPHEVVAEVRPVQLTLGLDDMDTAPTKHLVGSHVFLWLRTIHADNVVPYELCALRTEGGVPTLCYTSYVYCSDLLSIAVELKASVGTAPRMAELVPDLVKFFDGTTVICLQLVKVRPYLEDIAKALRYTFNAEWWDGDGLLKKGKETLSFQRACKSKQIERRSDAAEDMAHALYELYLSEKGIG